MIAVVLISVDKVDFLVEKKKLKEYLFRKSKRYNPENQKKNKL